MSVFFSFVFSLQFRGKDNADSGVKLEPPYNYKEAMQHTVATLPIMTSWQIGPQQRFLQDHKVITVAGVRRKWQNTANSYRFSRSRKDK